MAVAEPPAPGLGPAAAPTVRALSFVLPSGTALDTDAPGAEERFAREEPELARGLREIRDTSFLLPLERLTRP